ncbi:hypothetical protein BEL07_17920 [Mycolicibacterium grossiae]|jgi:S-DNA-T family DNA segregation ATPase FtsK/SpoIIIE|uniref:Uncharacterized protein n=1 Tax=Mycolicibacterium grossiae TaxID=1552759 RepID=A0A1E8Q190_9MYCO|nr:hypothetical protein [Mycolicibacterium grossiae]OFJ52325.1 hypothetical protein BEL07_17920 [Mycolicibacterium grossiae]
MLIDTNDLVSATDFNRNTGRYTALAAEGRRIVIIKDQQLVAALVGIHDLNRLDALDSAPELAFDEAPGTESAQPSVPPPPGALAIGHTVTGEAAYVDPRQSLMVVGRGASDFMSALLARVGEESADLDLEFVIASGRDLLLPRPSAPDRVPAILSVAADMAQAHESICRLADQVAGEMERRSALLAESSVNTIDQYRRLNADSPGNLVVVVDADGADPGALHRMVSEVSRRGERLGISVWLFAVAASQKSGLPGVEISQRVALPMETPAHSRDVVYSDVAYRLKAGQAVLLKRGGDLAPFRVAASEDDVAFMPAIATVAPERQWPPLPTSPPLDSIVAGGGQDDGGAVRLPIGVIDDPRHHSHPVYSLTLTRGKLTEVQTDNEDFAEAFVGAVMRSASLAVDPSVQGVRFLYIGAGRLLPEADRASLLGAYSWEQFVEAGVVPGDRQKVTAMTKVPARARTAVTTVLIAETVSRIDGMDNDVIITDLVEKALREDAFHVLMLRRGGVAGDRTLRGLRGYAPANAVYGRLIDYGFLDREVRNKLRGLPEPRAGVFDAVTSDGCYLVLGQ